MASNVAVDEKSIALRTRLAQLFIDSVRLQQGSEVEFRNSLSRAYYALFHAGMALMLSARERLKAKSGSSPMESSCGI